MLRFILNVLLLRRFISSRSAKRALLWVALVFLLLGFIYAYIVFHAISERSHTPHVHAHSTH